MQNSNSYLQLQTLSGGVLGWGVGGWGIFFHFGNVVQGIRKKKKTKKREMAATVTGMCVRTWKYL